jgi:glycosyltransferase involved in cell wall biosynthesis
VAPARPATLARQVAREVRSDIRYLRGEDRSLPATVAWGGRSLRHHGGRALFASLGSRADRLPPRMVRRLSLEGTTPAASSTRPARIVRLPERPPYRYVRSHFTDPETPLAAPSPHDATRAHLHFAWVIPPFRRGSGGHMTLFTIAQLLEQRGHSCSIWVHDPGRTSAGIAAVAQRELTEHFAPLRAGVFDDFSEWFGADVAFATGWQTAYPLWELGGCKLKAYFVQDYEPDFYGASAERLWAARTYEMGYPCVAASRWLAELLRERYGASADDFELGVDLETYRPRDLPRRDDTVVFYARPATPRRATNMGLLALDELARRRPDLNVVLFGDTKTPRVPFRHEFRGVMTADSLADLYNEATVGLVISLTNYSRMPKEMMACGLPVVDVRHPSVVSAFGSAGQVIELADMDFVSIADRLEALLDDPARRAELAQAAQRFVSGMTWEAATDQIEAAVRQRLAARWEAAVAGGGGGG